MSQTRPNILWISFEDTSPRYGCYGDALARTPNIDRLAAEGQRFPNAFCTAPVCAPSRIAILTGVYATTLGAMHMRTTHQQRATPEMPTPYETVPPHYVKTLTESLRAEGYYCTNNQKTDYQMTPPFTAWDESGPKAHWRNRPANQPFFAVFNPTFTHESGMWPKEGEQLATDPAAVTVPPYLPDTLEVRKTIARQYDNLAKDDAYAGEILKQLEEDGLAENTIVMHWSDHGEGLPRGKRWPYDAGIRIPLIVRWPGQPEPNTVNENMVSLIDLAPTVLAAAGVAVPRHMQGAPFIGEGKRAEARRYVFAARDRFDEAYDMVRAVRDNRYKYLRHYRPDLPYLLWIPYRNRHPAMKEMVRLHLEDKLEGPQKLMFQSRRPPEELYDVEADPYEINNLADDANYEPVLRRMRRVLEVWRRRTADLGEMDEAQLVQRMWPNRQQPGTAPAVFVLMTRDDPGQAASDSGGTVRGPASLQMHCATQGASVGYRFADDPADRWRLYAGPVRLKAGAYAIEAKCIRYGYRESDVRRFEVQVMDC